MDTARKQLTDIYIAFVHEGKSLAEYAKANELTWQQAYYLLSLAQEVQQLHLKATAQNINLGDDHGNIQRA